MAIQISQFRRPGIYIQEIDQSLQVTPIQESLINLVAGFSKKGPVNRPVLVSSPAEFTSVFGDVDRALEKKGSYFHRTVQNIINQSPVWALNLLKTDDELDLLEWQSISLAANVSNSTLYEDPYSNFFNRNEFWIRDTEAFLDVAHKKQPTTIDKILHITNMSDSRITIFMFKSSVSGFDVKAEDWYQGRENVPTWMYYDDYISDYMMTVVAVTGDWSDYQQLAVDSRWGSYFNNTGLIKDQVNNFINDSSVTLLNKYDVSLIPFFRDQNGTDYYIETVINRDTDTTGLFVSYDVDALETDYPNGIIDLNGWTLVNDDVNVIDFISYKELITETVNFEQQPLASAGNTFIEPNVQVEYANNYLNGLYETKWIETPEFTVESSDPTDPNLNSISRITINNLNDAPRLILNGTDLTVLNYQEVVLNDAQPGQIRKDTLYIDSLGQFGVATGPETTYNVEWDVVPVAAIADVLYAIGIVEVGTQINDIPAGEEQYLGVVDASAVTILANDIANNDYAYVWKTTTSSSTSGTEDIDVIISQAKSSEVTITFNRTKNSDTDLYYKQSRSLRMFEDLIENIYVGNTVIMTNSGKTSIIDVSYVTDANSNKSVTVYVPDTIVISQDVELYFEDNATTFGEIGMRAVDDMPDYGIISTSSSFYNHFYDGIISSGDYFYQNILTDGNGVNAVEFTKDSLGQSIVSLYSRDAAPIGEVSGSILDNDDDSAIDGSGGDMIFLRGVALNNGIFTVLSTTEEAGTYTKGGIDYGYKLELIVNESINEETQYNQLLTLHDGNPDKIVYLKMYTVQNDLYVDFANSDKLEVAGEQRIVPSSNPEIWIFSDRSNFTQTIEIETILEQNQFLIDANRYGEVIIGDFLEATISEDLPIGYVPKQLTRIVKRQIWEADPSLALIATDAAIAYIDADPSNNADIQVVRRTGASDYVNTYQSKVLKGFRMRNDSMPNGTETRQNDILNIFAAGTPIFKGLTNRNQLSWRYFIDAWGLGLTSNSKQQMVDLCGARLNALGLINMPSAKSFKNSTNPSFIDPDGTVNYEYVRLGGNPESNPAFRYTLGQGQGQSNVAYFYPYASINDNGRPVNVPPAMFVTNTFMNKHNSRRSDMYPWTIAAGVTNGLVVGFGATEVDLIGEDIEELNEMGANPVVFKLNRGYNIETNNTAQAVPKSALSNIHVREVLIELENEMYNMLLTYQWRFNTTEVRAEIKQRADAICARFVSQNGLYDYFNVMDETNNTSEVIDAGIGVIDTYVEPIKGMGIIVNNITILSTGTIQSGGFITTT